MKDNLSLLLWNIVFLTVFLYENLTTDAHLKFFFIMLTFSDFILKNLKPFSLEDAKEGKPVCTRDGRKARIICFDLQSIGKTPIVAAVQVTDKQEVISHYYEDGRLFVNGKSGLDLMMLPEKKEGGVNLYPDFFGEKKENI